MAQTNKSVFFTALNSSLFRSQSSVSHPGASLSLLLLLLPCFPRRCVQGPPLAIGQRGTILQGRPWRAAVKSCGCAGAGQTSPPTPCVCALSALVLHRIKDGLRRQSGSVRRYKQEKCFIRKETKKLWSGCGSEAVRVKSHPPPSDSRAGDV